MSSKPRHSIKSQGSFSHGKVFYRAKTLDNEQTHTRNLFKSSKTLKTVGKDKLSLETDLPIILPSTRNEQLPVTLTEKKPNKRYENPLAKSTNLNEFRKSSISSITTANTAFSPSGRGAYRKQSSTVINKLSSVLSPISPPDLTGQPNKTFAKRNSCKYVIRSRDKITKISSTSVTSVGGLSSEDEDTLKTKNNVYNQGYSFSQAGLLDDGESKTNQDSFLILQNIFGIRFNIYGIMDGHGTNGHFVSQYVRDTATEYFTNVNTYLHKNKNKKIDEVIIFQKISANNYKIIRDFYHKVDKDLYDQKFDCHFSGTTCVMAFHIGGAIICSNVGDSRCVLTKTRLSHLNKQGFDAELLSNDHKPTLEKERKRIESSGGSIDQAKTDGVKDGPYRVWVKGEEYPGLAISRSIGDLVAETVGVISEPEIILKENAEAIGKFLVLGSDGLFDYLELEDIIDVISPYYLKGDPSGAANAVVQEAIERWAEVSVGRDDITSVIVFFGGGRRSRIKQKDSV